MRAIVREGFLALSSLSLAGIAQSQVPDKPDPNLVVDARGLGALPPGVPRLEEVENSPGKEAWLRGMDAVVARDWQLAHAWFETARRKDPTNAALARAVDLAKWTWDRQKARLSTDSTRIDRATLEALQGQPQAALPAPPTPSDAAMDAEIARLEAELDKRSQSPFDLFEPPLTGDPRALEVVRARERKRVEQANLALADQLAGEAIEKIKADDLAGAIELLRLAELLAPQIQNFRATQEWLQTQVAARRAETTAIASIRKAANEAEEQVRAREDEVRRAESAVVQAERAVALAREYQDPAAEQISQAALTKAHEAVRIAKARVARVRQTAERWKALLKKQEALAATSK